MAESVLSKLVGTDKETKASLVSIDTTLQKMYAVQAKEAKQDAKRAKRSAQDDKRDKGDKSLVSKLLYNNA